MSGARLVVAAPGDHRDPAKLVALINREGVDTLHFVPSMLQAFLQDEDVVSCTSLKRIVCSGEANIPLLGLQDALHFTWQNLDLLPIHHLHNSLAAGIGEAKPQLHRRPGIDVNALEQALHDFDLALISVSHLHTGIMPSRT